MKKFILKKERLIDNVKDFDCKFTCQRLEQLFLRAPLFLEDLQQPFLTFICLFQNILLCYCVLLCYFTIVITWLLEINIYFSYIISYRYTKTAESTFERVLIDITGTLKKIENIQSKERVVNQIPLPITKSRTEFPNNKKTCFICQKYRIDVNGAFVDNSQYEKGRLEHCSADDSAKKIKQSIQVYLHSDAREIVNSSHKHP